MTFYTTCPLQISGKMPHQQFGRDNLHTNPLPVILISQPTQKPPIPPCLPHRTIAPHQFEQPPDNKFPPCLVFPTTTQLLPTASTTLNSSYHVKFAEFESAIKANQNTFKSLNTKYEAMENQILETMSTCHENTKQLVVMQGQMHTLQTTMQSIADQMQLLTQHFHPSEQPSPVKKKQCHIQPYNSPNTDSPANQEGAQYHTPRSPSTAMVE